MWEMSTEMKKWTWRTSDLSQWIARWTLQSGREMRGLKHELFHLFARIFTGSSLVSVFVGLVLFVWLSKPGERLLQSNFSFTLFLLSHSSEVDRSCPVLVRQCKKKKDNGRSGNVCATWRLWDSSEEGISKRWGTGPPIRQPSQQRTPRRPLNGTQEWMIIKL